MAFVGVFVSGGRQRDEEWRQPQCKRSPSRRRDHYAIIRASVDASAESVAFIGAGNMAEAIVNGLSGCGVVNREKIIVSTRNVKRREDWAKTGVVVKEDNVSAAKSADVVFLAVKPYGIVDVSRIQSIFLLCTELSSFSRPREREGTDNKGEQLLAGHVLRGCFHPPSPPPLPLRPRLFFFWEGGGEMDVV